MPITPHHRKRRLRSLAFGIAAVAAFEVLAVTVPTAAQVTPGAGGRQAIVTVRGMQCPFCAYGIKRHLAKLTGVTKVEVELARNQAILTLAPDANVTDAQIQQAVRKAGFTPDKIEWRSGGPSREHGRAHADREMLSD